MGPADGSFNTLDDLVNGSSLLRQNAVALHTTYEASSSLFEIGKGEDLDARMARRGMTELCKRR